jgi:hypothetical protein
MCKLKFHKKKLLKIIFFPSFSRAKISSLILNTQNQTKKFSKIFFHQKKKNFKGQNHLLSIPLIFRSFFEAFFSQFFFKGQKKELMISSKTKDRSKRVDQFGTSFNTAALTYCKSLEFVSLCLYPYCKHSHVCPILNPMCI